MLIGHNSMNTAREAYEHFMIEFQLDGKLAISPMVLSIVDPNLFRAPHIESTCRISFPVWFDH